MEWFFGDGADAYREMHFEDACMFIPYGCMVDEFQHIVYENPELTPRGKKGGVEQAGEGSISLIWIMRKIPSLEREATGSSSTIFTASRSIISIM